MQISCCWMYAIGKYGFPPTYQDMLRAIDEMSNLGFEYIELEGVGYDNLGHLIENRAAIKDKLESAGVSLSNFAVILPDVISMDKKVQEKAVKMFAKAVETAAYLGSPNVWIDSYYAPVEYPGSKLFTEEISFGNQMQVRVPESFSWLEFWEHFVEAVRKCTGIVKENGMNLLIEPRVGEVTSNSEALLRLGEAVNDESFGVILDTAHQHAQKELLPLTVHKLGGLLKYVHVADNDGRENYHYGIGRGNIDWDGVFESLEQINYRGFFAIDLEKMDDLEEKFVENKKILEEYGRKYKL